MKTYQFCCLNALFLPHPLPPLPRGERGGSTPHPAVHVRERRDHSPRGEWYLARRTLWQVLEKMCADALPCYKEFATLILFSAPIPLTPFPHGKGERISQVSAPMRAQPARFARKRKQQKNSLRSFSAAFVSAASGCRGCARGGATLRNRIMRRAVDSGRHAQALPRACSVVYLASLVQKSSDTESGLTPFSMPISKSPTIFPRPPPPVAAPIMRKSRTDAAKQFNVAAYGARHVPAQSVCEAVCRRIRNPRRV